MMGVTAPGQDVRNTQKHFTPTSDKGPTPQVVPTGSHLLILPTLFPPPPLGRRTSFLPNSLSPSPSILQGSGPSSPGIFQKCSLHPLNSQRAFGVHLSEVPDHLPACAHVICQRLQGAGSRGLVLGIFAELQDTPTPAHHQHRATHNEHLTKMND